MDFTSSTGQGLALRIKTLALLIVPILNAFGVPLVSEDADKFIDAIFIVVFSVWQAYAWARAHFYKDNKLGKYSV